MLLRLIVFGSQIYSDGSSGTCCRPPALRVGEAQGVKFQSQWLRQDQLRL